MAFCFLRSRTEAGAAHALELICDSVGSAACPRAHPTAAATVSRIGGEVSAHGGAPSATTARRRSVVTVVAATANDLTVRRRPRADEDALAPVGGIPCCAPGRRSACSVHAVRGTGAACVSGDEGNDYEDGPHLTRLHHSKSQFVRVHSHRPKRQAAEYVAPPRGRHSAEQSWPQSPHS